MPYTPLEARIKIGTSGYVFDDWVGPFYPPRLPRADFLRFYAQEFSVVEVNATYYRIPPPRTMAAMVRKTPAGFRFVIKANQEMTHRGSRDPDLYRRFEDTVAPARDAGKLDGVLLQFPFRVKNDAISRRHLAFLRDALPSSPVWAEFRHASWNHPPVFEFLRDHDIGYCAVDEPDLENLMPGVCTATTDRGYVRFHGRNAADWWGSDGHRRYDWEYTENELGEWLERIRDLAHSTRSTYVFFNNCYMGRAVKGARLLRKLLGMQGKLDLGL
jgi:uncharacterized protein YecE (DUF72 family)